MSKPSSAESIILNEDCITGMRNLLRVPLTRAINWTGVDVVVTSPPYNRGIPYRTYQDKLPHPVYLEWCAEWMNLVSIHLTHNGSFFLNVGASAKQPTLPFELVKVASEFFTLQNTFHWIKSITVNRPEVDGQMAEPISVGHFKPVNSDRYVTNCHEYVFHFTHHGDVKLDRLAIGVPYADKSNVGRFGKSGRADLRCRGNNWYLPYETITSQEKDRPHPATFPVSLPERCLRLHGKANPVVMDPFMGIGSSWLAADRVSASKFIGFEIDAGYTAEARRRRLESLR